MKAAYTLIEQIIYRRATDHLHCFSQQAAPNLNQGNLRTVSMLPAWVEEFKRSAARAGALTALTRAKAWVPDLDLVDVGKGYPSLKEDRLDFDNDDL